MKSTGFVKRIDSVGRFVVPTEVRGPLQIQSQDALEIYVDNDCIILKKYEPACIFCGNATDNITFMDKKVCKECIEKLSAE